MVIGFDDTGKTDHKPIERAKAALHLQYAPLTALALDEAQPFLPPSAQRAF
jgi:hypothetical protein